MESEEFIGTFAGKVWKVLREGDKTLSQIQKSAGLTTKEASMGLGWLAREGKITIKNADGLYFKFSLLD